MTLTGRTRFRAGDAANPLVMQVEVAEVQPIGSTEFSGFEVVKTWRDATVEDLCELNHLNYSRIHVEVRLPEPRDSLPGEEKNGARKLH